MLERWVARQAEQIGAEIAACPSGRGELAPVGAAGARSRVDEWNRLAARALVPRLAGFASWVKRAELPPSERLALEGIARRWKKRADDCVLDWAELLTDPVALAEGFAGSRRQRKSRHRARRRLAAPPARPAAEGAGRRGGQPGARLRGPAARRRRGRPGRPVRRRGRSDPAPPGPAQARRPVPPTGDELTWRARRGRRGPGPLGARDQGPARGRARARRRPRQALGHDRRRHRAAPGVRQQLLRLGRAARPDRPARDRPPAAAVVPLDRRGHGARPRDPRPRARPRRAARRPARASRSSSTSSATSARRSPSSATRCAT